MVILIRKIYEAIDSVVFFCCGYYLRTATIAGIMVLLRKWAYPRHTKIPFKAEREWSRGVFRRDMWLAAWLLACVSLPSTCAYILESDARKRNLIFISLILPFDKLQIDRSFSEKKK